MLGNSKALSSSNRGLMSVGLVVVTDMFLSIYDIILFFQLKANSMLQMKKAKKKNI